MIGREINELRVSADALGKVLGISGVMVGRLSKQGDLPPTSRGEGFALVAAVHAFLAYRDRQAAAKDTASAAIREEELRLVQARRRKTEAEHESQEMENAIQRGVFVRGEDAEKALTEAISVARARLLAIPSGLAPKIVAMSAPAEVKRAIETEIHGALEELSRAIVSPAASRSGGDGGAGDEGDGGMEAAA